MANDDKKYPVTPLRDRLEEHARRCWPTRASDSLELMLLLQQQAVVLANAVCVLELEVCRLQRIAGIHEETPRPFTADTLERLRKIFEGTL